MQLPSHSVDQNAGNHCFTTRSFEQSYSWEQPVVDDYHPSWAKYEPWRPPRRFLENWSAKWHIQGVDTFFFLLEPREATLKSTHADEYGVWTFNTQVRIFALSLNAERASTSRSTSTSCHFATVPSGSESSWWFVLLRTQPRLFLTQVFSLDAELGTSDASWQLEKIRRIYSRWCYIDDFYQFIQYHLQ